MARVMVKPVTLVQPRTSFGQQRALIFVSLEMQILKLLSFESEYLDSEPIIPVDGY